MERRKILSEILGITLMLGILLGLPITIFSFRNSSAIQHAPAADAVIVLAGRNDGAADEEGDWIVEYANVPISKDDKGIPVIHVRHGQRVLFRVTGKDISHGLAIEEYGIDVVVHPGVYEDVTFIADKSGEFKIECSLFCGLGHHGMIAKLIVEA